MTYEVRESSTVYSGAIIDVHVDTVAMPDGDEAQREVVEHADSVAIVALDDEQRVAVIEQYRHPLRARLRELPAGLCDEDGESAVDAARRELAEEVGVRAGTWRVLCDIAPSPGISTERVRVYLATDLDRGERESGSGGEEDDLSIEWVPLRDLLGAVLRGEVINGHTVAGLLAAGSVLGVASDIRGVAALRSAGE